MDTYARTAEDEAYMTHVNTCRQCRDGARRCERGQQRHEAMAASYGWHRHGATYVGNDDCPRTGEYAHND